jgi:hypothetical protein
VDDQVPGRRHTDTAQTVTRQAGVDVNIAAKRAHHSPFRDEMLTRAREQEASNKH